MQRVGCQGHSEQGFRLGNSLYGVNWEWRVYGERKVGGVVVIQCRRCDEVGDGVGCGGDARYFVEVGVLLLLVGLLLAVLEVARAAVAIVHGAMAFSGEELGGWDRQGAVVVHLTSRSACSTHVRWV